MEYPIELTANPVEQDSAFIRDKLDQFNMQHVEHHQHTILQLYIRNERDELIGGLLGETYWHWLHISILWVDEKYRNAGLGQQLMAKAEAEAIARGCLHADVDTFDFQAPGFYQQLGYTLWGVLEDLPPGHRRMFFKKDLAIDNGS
jgi:GNAT superfamily N-acetyltransferase